MGDYLQPVLDVVRRYLSFDVCGMVASEVLGVLLSAQCYDSTASATGGDGSEGAHGGHRAPCGYHVRSDLETSGDERTVVFRGDVLRRRLRSRSDVHGVVGKAVRAARAGGA